MAMHRGHRNVSNFYYFFIKFHNLDDINQVENGSGSWEHEHAAPATLGPNTLAKAGSEACSVLPVVPPHTLAATLTGNYSSSTHTWP